LATKGFEIAHYALDNDLTLKAPRLKLGFVTEAEFDRVVDPKKMVKPMWRRLPPNPEAEITNPELKKKERK